MSKLKKKLEELVIGEIPGGDFIIYFSDEFDDESSVLDLLVGLIPVVGTPFVMIKSYFTDDEDEPRKEDIDRYEGRGRVRGRSSRRRGRPVTDGSQVVTGGGGNDDDGGSGIPSMALKGLFSIGLLVGILFLGMTIVSDTLGDYGQVAAEEVQDETVGGIAPDISEDVTAGVQNGVGALRCINAGPGCIQEWRLENAKTEQPDSKDATKTFDLSVRNFELGREGEAFDISSESAEDGIPVEMRIFNNRRGVDGIRARDVEFRILMVNGEFDTRTPLCDTGWVSVDKIPQLPAYDVDGDGEADDLPPGTGLSSGFLRLDRERITSSVNWDGDYITPKSCHLLQPGVGEEAEIRLGVRYEYFSTAGLIFEAMSNSYIQNSQSIKRDTTQSLSPDTPVQAALSLDGPVPVLDDRPSSFSLRALMETDEDNVRFVAQDMRIINSRKACVQGTGISDPECVNDPSGDALDCSFKPSSENQNVLIPKESALEEYRGKGPDGRTFFDDQQSPQTAGCQMMLRNPESISRTGETLAIRMEANYTVIKNRPDDFEAANLICTEKNCPHVFVLSGDTLNAEHLSATQSLLFEQDSGQDSSETGSSNKVFWRHRRAECDGRTDDGPNEPGCTVVSGDKEEGFRQATAVQGGLKGSDGNLQTIEEGEIAMKIEDTSKDIFTACVRKDSVKNPDEMTGVHGAESSDLHRITGNDADPQLNWTGEEWKLEDEESPCKGSSGSGSGDSSGSGSGDSSSSGSGGSGGSDVSCQEIDDPDGPGDCPDACEYKGGQGSIGAGPAQCVEPESTQSTNNEPPSCGTFKIQATCPDRCDWDDIPGPKKGECETP